MPNMQTHHPKPEPIKLGNTRTTYATSAVNNPVSINHDMELPPTSSAFIPTRTGPSPWMDKPVLSTIR